MAMKTSSIVTIKSRRILRYDDRYQTGYDGVNPWLKARVAHRVAIDAARGLTEHHR
jgi:hypothetical protein